MVYCSVHPESVDAFFTESSSRNLRMVAGKVLMDRNCPEFLRDTPESGARDTERLILQWHNKGRQAYAITPRFAPTSSARADAPGRRTGAQVSGYVSADARRREQGRSGVGGRAVSAGAQLSRHLRQLRHAAPARDVRPLHLADDEDRSRAHGPDPSAVAVCPTSNLFLGSGLFDFQAFDHAGVLLSLATDVGGRHLVLDAADAWGGVQGRAHEGRAPVGVPPVLSGDAGQRAQHAAGRHHRQFRAGAEADFVVLDPRSTPLLARRTSGPTSWKKCCSRSRCWGTTGRSRRRIRAARCSTARLSLSYGWGSFGGTKLM
jgi:guanine deaminase